MAIGVSKLIGRRADHRALDHWKRLADLAGSLDFSELKTARSRAVELRQQIDRLCRTVDGRMAEAGPGGSAIEAPLEADWRWRPDSWRLASDPAGRAAVSSGTQLVAGLSMFHDCRVSELTLRQVRNRGATDLAPFGLRMDVFGFDGSFLSLVLDLPQAAIDGVTKRHLVGLSVQFDMERPLEIFARLNIRHGPNTEQFVREIAPSKGEARVEFDLTYCELNEKRIEAAWLDLIFEGPEMNQVEIHDLTMYRRPRAEI